MESDRAYLDPHVANASRPPGGLWVSQRTWPWSLRPGFWLGAGGTLQMSAWRGLALCLLLSPMEGEEPCHPLSRIPFEKKQEVIPSESMPPHPVFFPVENWGCGKQPEVGGTPALENPTLESPPCHLLDSGPGQVPETQVLSPPLGPATWLCSLGPRVGDNGLPRCAEALRHTQPLLGLPGKGREEVLLGCGGGVGRTRGVDGDPICQGWLSRGRCRAPSLLLYPHSIPFSTCPCTTAQLSGWGRAPGWGPCSPGQESTCVGEEARGKESGQV